MRHLLPFVMSLFVGLCSAQCALQVVPTGTGIPGTNQSVRCLTGWDADGPGPAPWQLVLGGDFQFAGSQLADRVAGFEPGAGQWLTLGALGSSVTALAALPNGTLVPTL